MTREPPKHVIYALVAAIFLFGTTAALVGVDYGKHWDEWQHVTGMKNCLERLEFRPSGYTYNGMYFQPGFVALLLHAGDHLAQLPRELMSRTAFSTLEPERYPTLRYVQTTLVEYVQSNAYRVETRRVFVFLSMPCVLWIFFAFRRLFPDRWGGALAATAFLGLSWEVVTTARHIAVDAPAMQFATLQLMALAYARRPRNPVAYLGAMVAAGFAGGFVLGCKTTGAFSCIVPAMAAFLLPCPWPKPRHRLGIAAIASVAALCGFFLTTPTAFTDPLRYVSFMLFQKLDYNSVGPGYPYYVSAPWEHWGRLALYLTTAVPSYFMVPAALMTAVAGYGFVVWWKRDKRFLLVWMLWAAAYFFVLRDVRLLQIRNNLMFIPFIAVAFGLGAGALFEKLKTRRLVLAQAFVAAVVGVFLVNAGWIAYTAWTIRATTVQSLRADAARYLLDRNAVRVSPRVKEALAAALAGYRCELVGPSPRGTPIDETMLIYSEHPQRQWLANRPFLVDRTFSSYEMNYEWYSTWHGHFETERIIAMPTENAAEMRVDMSGFFDCRRGR